MYFLRVPRPDLSELEVRKQQLDSELAIYRDACAKALAAAKLANEAKLAAKEEHDAAFRQVSASRAERDALMEKLRPLRDASRQIKEHRETIGEQRKGLPVSSVAELEQLIADLEFKQAHESMTRRDESNLINEVRRLRKLRPEVEQFEVQASQLEQTRDAMATFKSSKEELEKQLTIVMQECDAAWELKQKRKAALDEAFDNHKAVSADFDRLKAAQEEKYQERQEVWRQLKTIPNQFFDNRRFSKKVREMLTAGKLEEAVAACSEVTERLVGELVTNRAAWGAYVGAWELQRKYSVSEAVVLGEGDPVKSAKANGKAGGGASTTHPTGAAGIQSAEDIVADIMAAIEGRTPAAKPKEGPVPAPIKDSAATAAATDAATAAATNGAATSAAKPGGAGRSAADKAGPTAAVEAEAPAPKAKGAPKVRAKAAAAPRGAAADAAENGAGNGAAEEFELPEAIVGRGVGGAAASAEEERARVRAQQAAKAAEAEARKRKVEERRKQKATKAAEQHKEREEAEAARKEAEAARVMREAERQRSLAAKRKEAAERKAAADAAAAGNASKAAAGAKAAHARPLPGGGTSKARSVVAARARPTRSTLTKRTVAFCNTHGTELAVGAAVALVAALAVVGFLVEF